MTFQLLLFATLKQKIGRDRISLDLQGPVSVTKLLEALYQNYPQLIPYQKSVLIAVNKSFAFPEQIVSDTDEIALFPPVSGG